MMISKNRHPQPLLMVILVLTLVFGACSEKGQQQRDNEDKAENAYEDFISQALDDDPKKILRLVDSLEANKAIPPYKVQYYRAQAYYKLGQELTAEIYYKKALASDELFNERPARYYYACDQLSTILTCKGDQSNSIDIATKGYAKARHDLTETGRYWGAILLHDIGYCQMRLDHKAEAEKNFRQAYATLKELVEADSTYDQMNGWARVAYNILDSYTSTGNYEDATQWIASAEEAITRMASHPDCPQRTAEEYLGSLNTHKAVIYVKTGRKREADEAYRNFLQSDYAKTSFGLIDNSEYLSEAGRWSERAALTPQLDSLTKAWDMPISMYYFAAYLIPHLKAYLLSGQRDNALQIAQRIVDDIDSVNNYEQQHNAAELAIVYETQEKERQIAEQQSQLDYQRMLAILIALSLVIIFFAVFMYFRQRAARKLAEKNRELEQKNRELTVANARAEDSSRMKSNFIRQISHEIRTPLNILSGFTQVITTPGMQLDDTTKQDISQGIIENTERITGLVNRMLELSDSNSQTVIECHDDVTPLQIAMMAAEEAKMSLARHIKFDMVIGPDADAVTLHTNERQAIKALSQLLDNARKFTKEGTVRLTVEVSTDGATFTVEDTGIGVPTYEAERIFNEFVQLDEYYDGTGIGLAVARSIARRLGGDIVLDTKYTTGARFIMTIPL